MNLFTPLWFTWNGKERIAMGVVEDIYKLKNIFSTKKYREMARAQEIHGEFDVNWNVATLIMDNEILGNVSNGDVYKSQWRISVVVIPKPPDYFG